MNPHIKVGLFDPSSHTPLVEMSSFAPSCALRVAPVSCCGITCSSGSMQTLLHTSVSRLAVKSQISLCPYVERGSACSTVIPFPQSHLKGSWGGTSHITRPWHDGMLNIRSLRGRTERKNSEPSGDPGEVYGPAVLESHQTWYYASMWPLPPPWRKGLACDPALSPHLNTGRLPRG